MKTEIKWPDNIVADRHETTGRWVLWYLEDEQAEKCKQVLSFDRNIMKDNLSIGRYSISYVDDDKIWIATDSGEAGCFTKDALLSAIDSFYKEQTK